MLNVYRIMFFKYTKMYNVNKKVEIVNHVYKKYLYIVKKMFF